ncbi:hypothetical protein BDB00DRAFT_459849 [Zychaea mexicana]|uniref:uncharacterized protein n=1 Tax=Zychaea mexicana TaxID=64656 RepID=UPI0022FF15BA|nr:uncharacterized protein BDB00DRAFT_459849 [Zychaea mexicana]KAI9492067.1 hypothetical protein BDB00DRAFT_459849 [Zychaea mexicana]
MGKYIFSLVLKKSLHYQERFKPTPFVFFLTSAHHLRVKKKGYLPLTFSFSCALTSNIKKKTPFPQTRPIHTNATMGRTAVYTIGHVYKSPFKDAMVKTNSELQELRRQEGQEREAAQKAIELADLILKDLEHPDRDPIATDWDTRQTLKAVKACHYAHSVLSKEAFKNPDLLRHSLRYWIDALARLNHYDDAIELSKEYVTLLSDVDDLMVLYEAYHEIAGLYFCRGHDQDHAKFDDFDNARRFYSLERRALDQLPGDTEDLEDIKRSSDLNMGIIEAKEMGGLERAQTLFTSAFKTAAKLGKYIEQQTTAWEMGNAYRNHGHLEQLAKAQGIELSVIRRHKLKDKEVLVRFEIVKTRIEMGHYEKSRELLDDLRGLLDTEEINEELVKTI